MKRRETLKYLGGIGTTAAVGGLGLTALSGSAAASAVNITASNPGSLSNDRGEIEEVTVDPSFRVEWEDFDDAVGKIFYLVEAKFGQGGTYRPIFRATPWLTGAGPGDYPAGVHATKPGTTGHYELRANLSQAIANDPRYDSGTPPRPVPRPLVAFNRAGKPDYQNADYSSLSGVDAGTYLDGTSMGSASDAEGELVDAQGLALVNNFPVVNAGYYGAAGSVTQFENEADGTTASNDVFVRYTFELQRVNDGMKDAIINESGNNTTQLGEGILADVQPSDVDSGNSKIVMNGEDGNTDFQNPSGIPYDSLQANAANHVGIMVEDAKFTVSVTNEGSDAGVTGSTNAGVN